MTDARDEQTGQAGVPSALAEVRALLGVGQDNPLDPARIVPAAPAPDVEAQIRERLTSGAFWEAAFAEPTARPLLLLLQVPVSSAIAAWPVAASAFPTFPIVLAPTPGTREYPGAGLRQLNHMFSRWSIDPRDRPRATSRGPSGIYVGLFNQRLPLARLWRDVRDIVVPAAAGDFGRGAAFVAAALAALDSLIFQQGFRDKDFIDLVTSRLAGGDRARLLSLLPASRAALEEITYLPVPWREGEYEGFTRAEIAADLERQAVAERRERAEREAREAALRRDEIVGRRKRAAKRRRMTASERHARKLRSARRTAREARVRRALAAGRAPNPADLVPAPDDYLDTFSPGGWQYGEDEADGICPLCNAPTVVGAYQYCAHFVCATGDEYFQVAGGVEDFSDATMGLRSLLEEEPDDDTLALAPEVVRRVIEMATGPLIYRPEEYWTEYPDLHSEAREVGANLAMSYLYLYFHAEPAAFARRIKDEAEQAVTWLREHVPTESDE